MPRDGRQIANHILEIAQRDGNSMDLMTVLKLTYFAHGRCLARHDTPLVTDYIEAWQYGPVVPGIYFAFRPHGISNLSPLRLVPEEIDADAQDVIAGIYTKYRNYSGGKLSRMTHVKGGPWHKI